MRQAVPDIRSIVRQDATGQHAPLTRLLTDALGPTCYRLALAADPHVRETIERVGLALDRETDRIVPLLVKLIERELRGHTSGRRWGLASTWF